jgi:hypothetical protein
MAGAAAGTFYASAQLPGLNPHIELTLKLLAAIAIAALGRSASDCPKECPGTDENGRPRSRQPWLLCPVTVAAVLFVLAMSFCGCTSPNPQAGPDHPDQPAYIVNPQLTVASNTAAALAQTTGQVTGTGPLPEIAVNGVFATIGALSLLWARRKSRALATMGAGVAAAGPQAAADVLGHASDTADYAQVAAAVNDALPPGQSPGCCIGQTTPPKAP